MVRKYATTEIRQRQIIAAARRLIVARGAEHVTVRRIAREVGLSEAAIYRHFKSKKDVLRLLLDDVEQDLIDDADMEGRAGEASLDALHAVLKHHLSAVEQRRGIRFQVIAEIISLGDKSLNRRAMETVERYVGILRQLLSESAAAGRIRSDVDLEAAATLLFCMIEGLVNMWALSNDGFDLIGRYERMWRIFREIELGAPDSLSASTGPQDKVAAVKPSAGAPGYSAAG